MDNMINETWRKFAIFRPAAALRTALDKFKSHMERLVCGCERGQFEPGKNPFCLGRGCPGAKAGKKV